jgi:hypothetical protein
VAGRPPLFGFGNTVLDLVMFWYYHGRKPRGSSNFRPGSNPQHEDEVMSKADVSTTPIRSRRAVLAGLASTAALPIAAIVPADATTPHVVDPRLHWRNAPPQRGMNSKQNAN